MMRRLVTLAFLLAALPAAARDALEPPDPSTYLRWGFVRVRPGIEVSNLGYDNNILSSSSNPVSDYTATWSPKVEGLVLFGSRAFLEFNERLDFTAYLENNDQGFYNQRGSARLTFPLRRFGVFFEGRLDRLKERPVDLVDIRPERDEDAYGAGVILSPGWRANVELGWRHTRFGYFDRDFTTSDNQTIDERLDRVEGRARMRVTYRLAGRARLMLDAYREDVDFLSLTDGRSKDSIESSLVPGIDLGAEGKLSGLLRVGWTWIEPVDPVIPDFSDLVGNAKLSYKIGSGTTVSLEASRTPGFTVTDDTIYLLYDIAELRVVHYLNRSIGLEVGTSIGKVTFPEQTNNQREDDLNRYDVGVRLRLSQNSLGRRVEYRLAVGGWRRDSTPNDNLDQDRTTVSFGAVVGF